MLLSGVIVVNGVIFQPNSFTIVNSQSGFGNHIIQATTTTTTDFLANENKILSAISFCESSNNHYASNGGVLVSKTNDIGRYQINFIHLDEAYKKGIDIWTESGNRKYAEYLLRKNKLRDWSSSQKCWSKLLAYD